jgi:hypothetical protein
MMSKRTFGLVFLATTWLAAIAAGFTVLQNYSSKPGLAGDPKTEASGFIVAHQKSGRPLLVMAIHPECPCTEASLSELGDLLIRSHGAFDTLLLKYHAPGWSAGESTTRVGAANVPVMLDLDGKIAASLGAETSGYTLFYDAAGAVRFQGGITIARGHVGRAEGQDVILKLISGENLPLAHTRVYGCALTNDRQTP